jgi:hypothetical protein
MIVFGLPSSVSDILTSITLRLDSTPVHPARSGWFPESAIAEPAVTLTQRADRRFCIARASSGQVIYGDGCLRMPASRLKACWRQPLKSPDLLSSASPPRHVHASST